MKTVNLKWHDDVPKFWVRPPLCHCRISVGGRGVMTDHRVVMSYHYGVCRVCALVSSCYGCMHRISLVLPSGASCQPCWLADDYPDSKVHGANMSVPEGPHAGTMNLGISVHAVVCCCTFIGPNWYTIVVLPSVYHRIRLATIIKVVNYHHTSIHQQLRPITPNDTDFAQRMIFRTHVYDQHRSVCQSSE